MQPRWIALITTGVALVLHLLFWGTTGLLMRERLRAEFDLD